MSDAPIVHVLLAAGASRRMGRPKGLLAFGEGTLIEHRLAASLASRVDETLVVLGHDADRLAPIVERFANEHASASRIRCVTNPRPDDGQTTSTQCAVRALPDDAVAFVNSPLDYPGVTAADIDHVIDAWRSHSAGNRPSIATARHDGRRGRPTLFARACFAELLALAPDASVRALLERDPARVLDVDSPNPYILDDMDTPDDYREWLERLGLSGAEDEWRS